MNTADHAEPASFKGLVIDEVWDDRTGKLSLSDSTCKGSGKLMESTTSIIEELINRSVGDNLCICEHLHRPVLFIFLPCSSTHNERRVYVVKRQ